MLLSGCARPFLVVVIVTSHVSGVVGGHGDVACCLWGVVVVSRGKRWQGAPFTWFVSSLLGLPALLPLRVVLHGLGPQMRGGGRWFLVDLVSSWWLSVVCGGRRAATAVVREEGDDGGVRKRETT